MGCGGQIRQISRTAKIAVLAIVPTALIIEEFHGFILGTFGSYGIRAQIHWPHMRSVAGDLLVFGL